MLNGNFIRGWLTVFGFFLGQWNKSYEIHRSTLLRQETWRRDRGLYSTRPLRHPRCCSGKLGRCWWWKQLICKFASVLTQFLRQDTCFSIVFYSSGLHTLFPVHFISWFKKRHRCKSWILCTLKKYNIWTWLFNFLVCLRSRSKLELCRLGNSKYELTQWWKVSLSLKISLSLPQVSFKDIKSGNTMFFQ